MTHKYLVDYDPSADRWEGGESFEVSAAAFGYALQKQSYDVAWQFDCEALRHLRSPRIAFPAYSTLPGWIDYPEALDLSEGRSGCDSMEIESVPDAFRNWFESSAGALEHHHGEGWFRSTGG